MEIYPFFASNDTEEDLLDTQRIAEFARHRFPALHPDEQQKSVSTIRCGFPLISRIASVMPAAAMMKTNWVGKVVLGESQLGEQRYATLYLDQVTITESNVMVLEGWSLGSDLNFVESIALIVGKQVRSQGRTIHRGQGVMMAVPGAEGPDSGFLIRFPIEVVPHEETFLLVVSTPVGEQRSYAKVRFERRYREPAEEAE